MIKKLLTSPDLGDHKVIPVNYTPTIEERILQRRMQMLVHSYIYYECGTSIIADAKFDKWAYELRDLQQEYPEESKRVKYYSQFKDWDGTTGFNLPYKAVQHIAERLLENTRNANTK